MSPFVVALIVGAVLAIVGFLGPEDEGVLEIIGLAIIALSIWKLW